MTSTQLLFGILILIAVLAIILKSWGKARSGSTNFPLKARRPLSAAEQQMYFRLREALPECIVLAQVSFSALVTSRREYRNYYDRKYADYVLCDQRLTPIAIIELDDPTHKSKAGSDARRDAMLARAGYKTLRYTAIPQSLQIRNDILALLPKAHPPQAEERRIEPSF